MLFSRSLIFALCFTGASSVSVSASAYECPFFGTDPMAGFAPGDAMLYADLPVPDTLDATLPIELTLTNKVMNGEISHFSQSWCKIGIQTLIVDFKVPLEDDAISHQLTRTIYVWDATSDPIGWRIDALGTKNVCARGDDAYAALCP